MGFRPEWSQDNHWTIPTYEGFSQGVYSQHTTSGGSSQVGWKSQAQVRPESVNGHLDAPPLEGPPKYDKNHKLRIGPIRRSSDVQRMVQMPWGWSSDVQYIVWVLGGLPSDVQRMVQLPVEWSSNVQEMVSLMFKG